MKEREVKWSFPGKAHSKANEIRYLPADANNLMLILRALSSFRRPGPENRLGGDIQQNAKGPWMSVPVENEAEAGHGMPGMGSGRANA